MSKKKDRRHRRNRRAFLKTAALALGALIIPSAVHAEPPTPRHQTHSYWDAILNHVGHTSPSDPLWIKKWIAGTVHQPEVRSSGLILIGPQMSGKSTFHEAIGTLLGDDEYVVTTEFHRLAGEAAFGSNSRRRLTVWEDMSYNRVRDPRQEMLEFLGTISSRPGKDRLLVCSENYYGPGTNWVRRIELPPLRRPIPHGELFKRLEDERGAFIDELRRLCV